MKKINKILIANRGEIACRLIAVYKSMAIKTVAVFSEADKDALHVKAADEAVAIGAGPSQESYLNIKKIIEVAKKLKVDAIHPGYGFLSERHEFAEAVVAAKIIWIGPEAKTIAKMGNKIAAKKIAEAANVPTLAWALLKEGWTAKDLASAASKIGFPLLLKAAAGGGGRGMRLVESATQLDQQAESAMREAKAAFGSAEIFLEKYSPKSKHIEVQVLGDQHGNVFILGERDCSSQRRHQKVIEEASAASISDKTRKSLATAAKNLALKVNYQNAGTCEFLVDDKEAIFFLEMNTRLQVEHPVTEKVWKVNLPELQVRVAQGENLKSQLSKLEPHGHAIEVRVYAEDPDKNFMPSPGKISDLFFANHLKNIRVDCGYQTNSEVPIFYDAMIAKVIAWGADRETARLLLIEALEASRLTGIKNNLAYLIKILKHPTFQKAQVTTKFLTEEFLTTATTSAETSSQTTEAMQSITPWQHFANPQRFKIKQPTQTAAASNQGSLAVVFQPEIPLKADYPGKVLKVLVKNGEQVEPGQVLVVCESMKMEFNYSAVAKAKIKTVKVKVDQVISAGTELIHWESK